MEVNGAQGLGALGMLTRTMLLPSLAGDVIDKTVQAMEQYPNNKVNDSAKYQKSVMNAAGIGRNIDRIV